VWKVWAIFLFDGVQVSSFLFFGFILDYNSFNDLCKFADYSSNHPLSRWTHKPTRWRELLTTFIAFYNNFSTLAKYLILL
jgi:hypothetical protein